MIIINGFLGCLQDELAAAEIENFRREESYTSNAQTKFNGAANILRKHLTNDHQGYDKKNKKRFYVLTFIFM